MQPSTVKNDPLNQKCCGKLFPVLSNKIVSTDPLKETIKIVTKLLLLEILMLLFLKMWRRVNIKIQNSTIMAITVMK